MKSLKSDKILYAGGVSKARCAPTQDAPRICGAHLSILSHELAAERKVPRGRGAPFYLGQQSELVGVKFAGYFACSSLC